MLNPLKYSLIALALALNAAAPIQGRAESEWAKQFQHIYYEKLADRLFHTGEVPQHLELSLKYYHKMIKAPREQSDSSWKIARCYWALAEAASSRKEKLEYLRKGAARGKKSLKNNPANPYAYLWRFIIMESMAKEKGTLDALYRKDKLKEGFEKVLKLNPKSVEAYLGLGRRHFNTPGLIGGGKDKAFQLIEQALKINPDHTSALLLKAKFFIKEQKYGSALKTLERLSQTTQPAFQNKAEAAELIQQLKTTNPSLAK